MPETRLNKHHTDALWSIALSENKVDRRIVMMAPRVLGLDPLHALPVLTVEDAVKQLLTPAERAPRTALVWAFSAIYDATQRFATPSSLRLVNQSLQSLADAIGVPVPEPGSGQTAYQLLSSSSAVASTCTAIPVENTSCFFPKSQNREAYTRVRAVVEVNRRLEDLTHAMDPRNWQKCIGGPFLQAIQIEADPHPEKNFTNTMQLPFLVPRKSKNIGTPVDHVIPFTGGAADGKPWDGLLYEEFEVPSSGFKFRNIIVIKYEHNFSNPASPGDTITLTYEQTRNVTEWLGGSFIDLLLVNCGQTVAKRDPNDLGNRAIIEGYKDVSIDDMTPLTNSPMADIGKLLQLMSPGLLALWNQAENGFGMCC